MIKIKIPTADATAAFIYCMEHYNNGRTFIPAGHSQGSNVLLFLSTDYMKKHPDVYQRMVAAYVIGYPVTADYLKSNAILSLPKKPTIPELLFHTTPSRPMLSLKQTM